MAGSEKCFCDKHWQAMRGCGFFNARVWLGCLEAGITLIETYRLTEAEAQLVKAFIAGKLFFREHEVTQDALAVLTDTTAVLYVCLVNRGEQRLATEIVSSTTQTLSRVISMDSLRSASLNACHHLLSLSEVPAEMAPSIQLAMSRYVENPRSTAH
jgi:hypothetical protein